MIDFDNRFYAALGRVIDHHGVTFSPGLITEEVVRETGRPEEEVAMKVIEQCRELVEMGMLWFSSSHLYIKEESCLTVRTLRGLRPVIMMWAKKGAASSA